jgi:hypothetical protein
VITFCRRSKMIARCNQGTPWAMHFVPCRLLEHLAAGGKSFEALRRELAQNGETFRLL